MKEIYLPALVALSCLLDGARSFAENSVHIRSNYITELITSSTLRWVSAENGHYPDGAVIGTTEILPDDVKGPMNEAWKDDISKIDTVFSRKVYVCRARHNGIWIPGYLRPPTEHCVVSLHGKVYEIKKYEILEDIENGSRLSWIRWDRFSGVPVGTVSGGEGYIARRKAKQNSSEEADNPLGMKHLLGKLEGKGLRGWIQVVNQEGRVEEFTDGEILVETEPIRYELKILSYNEARKRETKRPVELGWTVLSNVEPVESTVDAAIGYDANYSLYWGQGKAILKGLPTVIKSSEGKLLEEIRWGIQETEERKNTFSVSKRLEPGTAVNVTLVGNNTETETPYTAKLVAMYSDGGNRARTIQGIQYEISMKDVSIKSGDLYFYGNGSLVPTTTTTTTTTPPPPTTTTSPPEETTLIKVIPEEIKKKENSSMMNDEGVKLKESQITSARASASAIQTCLGAVILLTGISRIL